MGNVYVLGGRSFSVQMHDGLDEAVGVMLDTHMMVLRGEAVNLEYI